jgi:hypothetical protein
MRRRHSGLLGGTPSLASWATESGSMDTVSAKAFLHDQVPVSAQTLVPGTLRSAYATARMIAKQEPILSVASAQDNHGRLISWSVDFAFEKLLKTQQWPFEFTWRDFALPTGRYLEVRFSHSVMSISQIANAGKQPRNVVFRENGRMNNEPFFDLREFDDVRSVNGLPHFLLIHGHQQLDFAHLAVPHSEYRRDWIYKTPNMMHLPSIVVDDRPKTESTEFDAAMELKQEIEKWRKDHGI